MGVEVQDRARGQRVTHSEPCTISSVKENGVPEVVPNNWPAKLIMQLIPKSLVQTLGVHFFRHSKTVVFNPSNGDSMKEMGAILRTGFAGCVHFPGAVGVKVLILLYSPYKDTFLGFMPNQQISFVERIRQVVQDRKNGQGQGRGSRETGQQTEVAQEAVPHGEQIFIENGREVRRIPVKIMSGEIC